MAAEAIVPILIGLAIVAAIAGLITWAVIATKRKRERFMALAAKHGWTADLDDRKFHARNLGEFGLFNIGDSRRTHYLIKGSHEGLDFAAFRYQYSTGTDKNRSTHYFRVMAIKTPYPAPPRPGLRFQPEHWGHKLWDKLGGNDIDFASDAFSRAYWVKCDRERFAFAVFHARMIEHLLDNPTKGVWQWIGDTVVVYWNGGLKVDQVQPMLDEVAAWRHLLPRAEVALPRRS